MKIVQISQKTGALKESTKSKTKVRAVLIEGSKVLLCEYWGINLFPGGKINKGEDSVSALIRELKEETGKEYLENELIHLVDIMDYQKDYPSSSGKTEDQFLITRYFVSKFNGIDPDEMNISEIDLIGGFQLKLVEISEISDILEQNASKNPRKSFFDAEIMKVIEVLEEDMDI